MEGQTSRMAPFLRLPIEARLQIYEELRVFTTPCAIHLACNRSITGHFTGSFHSSMLRTKRQTYKEAREIFYQKNTLKLMGASDDWTNGLAFETLQFTLLSALSSMRKVDLIFWLNASVMEMTYSVPNDEKQ